MNKIKSSSAIHPPSLSMPFGINPVDFFNLYIPFKDIFREIKSVHMKSDTEACFINPDDLQDDINNPTFSLSSHGTINVMKSNQWKIAVGSIISKFMAFSILKFNNDYRAAMSYIEYTLMKIEIPYVRVGTDFFKSIKKQNRWGGSDIILKAWKKDTITEDHTKKIHTILPKYDDFVIVPNNINYSRIHDNCYNLYSAFPHDPFPKEVEESEIPYSLTVIKHVFGEQFHLGIKYMKILYENPKQMLPVIVLVSEERGTGKTTFLDWIQMIFGENVVSVNPDNLTSQFNYIYATKNIILIDETIVEKTAGVEKLKSLTTAKTMSVNPKHVQGYSIPFFGKIIMCTNKVRDFMRIDKEENRFWIRYIKPVPGKKNTRIDHDLFDEIPKFIRYLSQMPPIDFTHDRLVFTLEETKTDHLDDVKSESKSWLHKELEILIEDFFANSQHNSFEATSKDIKEEWFIRNNQVTIGYIRKVLIQEMKIPSCKMKRYQPFCKNETVTERVGIPFFFESAIKKFSEKLDM